MSSDDALLNQGVTAQFSQGSLEACDVNSQPWLAHFHDGVTSSDAPVLSAWARELSSVFGVVEWYGLALYDTRPEWVPLLSSLVNRWRSPFAMPAVNVTARERDAVRQKMLVLKWGGRGSPAILHLDGLPQLRGAVSGWHDKTAYFVLPEGALLKDSGFWHWEHIKIGFCLNLLILAGAELKRAVIGNERAVSAFHGSTLTGLLDKTAQTISMADESWNAFVLENNSLLLESL